MSDNWTNATKSTPCPVCKKPDWCCTGATFINCMRVESDKPCTNGGWLHVIGDTTKLRPLPPKPERTPVIDAAKLMREFAQETWAGMKEELAASLGVALDALEKLGCAWAEGHRAWAFPMKNSTGQTIGIRLRDHTGHKWAVKGSRAGLFYAEGGDRTVFICEGPTDTAAAMSLHLCAIGRPSCLGCEIETDRLLKRKKAGRAVLISDNDTPGYRGAEKLQAVLSVPSVILVPPCKDLREFIRLGGTAALIDSLTRSLIWHQPKRSSH